MEMVEKGRAFRPLAEDAARSPTLPGFYYSDPEILEREKARIFEGAWHFIAHVSELESPGAYVSADILGEPVFVMRGRDGAVSGFYNVCQHRAHRLLSGKGRTKARIVCPYHAWSYELDGSLAIARLAESMPEFDPADYSLVPLQVETILGFVFVNLSPRPAPLAETMGDMFEDIRSTLPWIGEVRVRDGDFGWDGELAANWKVLAENCLECYHCGPAHPAFVDLVDMQRYVCVPHGRWLRSAGPVHNLRNKAYEVGADDPVQDSLFWHMWPGFEFGVFPGERLLTAFRFLPKTPDVTMIASLQLAPPGEKLDPERARYRSTVLWPEDKAICESVHQGLKSRGYRQGRFVVNPRHPAVSEHAVHHFQRLYAEAMGAGVAQAS